EKPDLAHRFGIEFDLLTTTNSPNAVNALVGGSVNVAAVTPDSAWGAQDKAPDAKQLFAVADGTPYVVLAQPEIKKATDLKGKTDLYTRNADVAANFVRTWDSITKWLYDPANKDEILAISKKTMGGSDKGVEAVYNLHILGKSVSQNLRINEKYMQQFLDNQ